ncbi:MAG TPA: S41 family peptidase [Candidatus Limnocylindrales bacterium]|nr:S41 family peptidase [Candidatus Limnocylindrales bacterium]
MTDPYRPFEQPPPAPRAAASIAAVLLIALTFVVGVIVGQTGLLGGGFSAAPASPTDAPAPGASGQPSNVPGSSQQPDAPANFDLFWEALQTIRDNYVGRDELDETELTYGAIRGLIEALGDTGHSVFLTPEEVASEQNALGGNVVGIGVILGQRESAVVVVSVISDGPAQGAGMLAGDEFLEVDGELVAGMETDQVAALVRGEEGTPVSVTVNRPSTGERLTFDMVRAQIRVPAAGWAMIPGTNTALLKLVQFSAGSAQELKQARDEAIAAGATSLVLDLRGNPGGYVDQAVDAASLFIPEGTVYVRELASDERIPVPVNPTIESTDLPMVVLIDNNSASSAEILAGALASAGRAQLIGETTFGTGTVLLPFGLPDGSSIRLAVERWLTPDEELIFGRGITPDEDVPLPPDGAPIEPDELRDLDPSALPSITDSQLLRALEILADQ